MRLRWLLLLLVALACSTAAFAQNYSFSVPEMMLEVTPNRDASVDLEYTITFHCNEGAHPIDVVDVGLPHKGYDISNMSASVNGNLVSGIAPSTYIDIGVEVHLDPYEIQPGQSGVFRFSCTMPNLVYQDTTRADSASLRITPTWFDSDLLTDTTRLAVVVYLPQSINLDEVLYQKVAFSKKLQLSDKNAVVWEMPETRVDHAHMVGVSFPKREMDRVVRMTKLGLLWKWWKENPVARFIWGVICLVLLGIGYFRITGGTGVTLYVIAAGTLAWLWAASPTLEAWALPVFVVLWLLATRTAAARRRKYLPAIASVEHGGIKRGLTVPEAAVILELPLGKVLTLLIFGMLKKGLIEQVKADSLTVRPAKGYEGPAAARVKTAKKNGTVIHDYEHPFLDKFAENPNTPIAKLNLKDEMKQLIQKAADRMSGFNLEETRQYYRYIITRAWAEAETLGDLSKRTQYVDNNLLWLMLADDYDYRFNRWYSSGYHYYPHWSGVTGAPGGAAAPAVGGRTTLGDVAASFAGWSENVSGHLASTLDPVSLGTASRGVVNLSGVDKVTMDVLDSMASGSGGGGGGGCACAGCACACACAGGGR